MSKNHFTTERIEPLDCKKASRAEKNRKFAKESRDRKRKYIHDLEVQVKELEMQIEIYREKLQKYELIEKCSNALGTGIYTTLINVCSEMYKTNQPLSNNFVFIETFKKKFEESLEGQRLALRQLTKIMVNISMPLPVRLSMWAIEKDIDITDYEKAISLLGGKVPDEDIKTLAKYINDIYPEKQKYKEMQIHMSDSGNRIKSLMKQIIELEKKIQIERCELGKYVTTDVVPNYNIQSIEVLAKITQHLFSIPDVSDYAIYQLTDSDFDEEVFANNNS